MFCVRMKQTAFEGFFSERKKKGGGRGGECISNQSSSETISKAEAKLEQRAHTGDEYLRYPLSHYLLCVRVEMRPSCVRN